MNKKITLMIISLVMISPTAAIADSNYLTTDTPTIAILDTAIDTSIPEFKGRISHEVCILEWSSCPNGQRFMEGPGSATLPLSVISKNGFDHGTQMTSAFLKNNTSSNVVFVRIIGNSSQGQRQFTTENTFINALDWVLKNKDRFNIQAAAMSQSHHNLMRGINYCPSTFRSQNKVKEFLQAGIPLFFPAGNSKDYKRISWPACIDESIAISASTDNQDIPVWSNIDSFKTDFHALGTMYLTTVGNKTVKVFGTSVSTQVAAAQWLTIKSQYPSLSYKEIYDIILNTSIIIPGPNGTSGKMINLTGALNE
jgi:hypothetical protein